MRTVFRIGLSPEIDARLYVLDICLVGLPYWFHFSNSNPIFAYRLFLRPYRPSPFPNRARRSVYPRTTTSAWTQDFLPTLLNITSLTLLKATNSFTQFKLLDMPMFNRKSVGFLMVCVNWPLIWLVLHTDAHPIHTASRPPRFTPSLFDEI